MSWSVAKYAAISVLFLLPPLREGRRRAEPDLSKLASAWHTDLDLGRPIEVMTDMTRSRKRGFTDYQETEESFFDLFAQLRAQRLIP